MSSNAIVDVFINPKSVAVIGASKNETKGGYRIIKNLVLNNFKGKIFPVNPNSEGNVCGLEFKKSVLEIEDEIDLAIFYVANRVVPSLLEDCVKKGVKGALIEAGGFEEVGDIGFELRDQIVKITDNFSKIRIVGPNCMGISRIDGDSDSNSDSKGGFFSGFGVFTRYKRGNVAIISQSGMMNGGYLVHLTEKYPEMGFRYSCSIGNKMDLSEIEFLEYFIEDPSVNVIALYLESFKDPRKFINLCKKAKELPNKTIIMVKGGLTSLGQKATLSHTGALSENSRLTEAVIKQAGVVQAHNFYDLFLFARTFSMMHDARKKLPEKGNIATIVGSGGAGTLLADLAERYGLNFPILGSEAYKTVKSMFPEWMPPNRFALLDVWPAMEKAIMLKANPGVISNSILEIVLNEPQIEGVCNMVFCSKGFIAMYDIDETIEIANRSSKPIFFWLIGEEAEIRRVSQLLHRNNIPSFSNLEDVIKNFWILVQESKNRNKKL